MEMRKIRSRLDTKKKDVNAPVSYNRKHFTTSCNKYSIILGKLIVDMDITGCGKGMFG